MEVRFARGYVLAIVAGLATGTGCIPPLTPVGGGGGVVPEPIDLLLPQGIHIHSFTGTRTFDEKGGIKGIEVLVTAKDAYGDATKAFGSFRFELHEFRPGPTEAKGKRRAMWEIPVMDPRTNRIHLNDFSRAYVFRLQWDQALPVGQKFILAATFSSEFTDRLFAERSFVAGE